MFTKSFWLQTAERLVKTAAGTFITLMGSDAAGWMALDWGNIGMGVLGTVILSLAFSLASTSRGDPDSPSWITITNKSSAP